MTRDEVNEAIEQLAPPAPPCFESRIQWHEWLRAAAEVKNTSSASTPFVIVDGKPKFNTLVSFCDDCSQRYRSAMLKQDRCYPAWARRHALIPEVA